MKIAVVILSFNSEKHFPDLLDSLDKTEWPAGHHEVIFIDNASEDGSQETLKRIQHEKGYTVFFQERNLGFAGGNNIGMQYALDNDCDYVVLLNDDTVVTPAWIKEMLAVMEAKKDAGAVQSLLVHWKDKALVNSWGNYIHFLGFQFAGGNLEPISDHPAELTVKPVTYCSGAAVMYAVPTLRKTGLFDETLESYHEDSEMGLAMRLKGYRSYLAPQSVVYHKYQFTGARSSLIGSGYKYYLMERNRLLFLLKFYSAKTLMLIFPAWFIMEVGTLAFAFIRGFGKEKIRAYLWCLTNMQDILEKRTAMKKQKKLSDKEFSSDFVGTIAFQEINNPLLQYVGNPILSAYWALVKKILL